MCREHRNDEPSTPLERHLATAVLPAAAVEVIHRVVNDSGSLTRAWAEVRIDNLGDARYAELVAVTAIITAIDVYTRSTGERQHELRAPTDGPPAAHRPGDVGDVGSWIPMTKTKLLANVSRALSLVPRTNATWRALVTESYSRGPQMLELTWERVLTRPQIELVAAHVSRLQDCFYWTSSHTALLRASSSALGTTIDLGPALERGAGVPAGEVLLEFATAAHLDRPDLEACRGAVLAAVGSAGLIEACLTVGAFNGLTRVADATGIVLDGGTLAATRDVRVELGMNEMAGALNTGSAVYASGAPRLPATVGDLFTD